MPTYALYYVPRKLEREKLALTRRQLCKRFLNRKAVMYPIHITLVRRITDLVYKPFTEELRELCRSQKPIKLKAKHNLVSRNGWGGVEIEPSKRLNRFQRELQALAQKHAKAEMDSFDPHISLVYAKRLPSLYTNTSPIKKLIVDRVTLAIQTKPGQPFRIARHVSIGE